MDAENLNSHAAGSRHEGYPASRQNLLLGKSWGGGNRLINFTYKIQNGSSDDACDACICVRVMCVCVCAGVFALY